jgi:DNA ligase 1
MPARFLEFAQLCLALSQTRKKLEKRALISTWLKTLSPQDAAIGALYLAGAPFSEIDRRALNLGSSLLSKAIAQVASSSPEAIHQAYLRHGDLGDAAFDLFSLRREVEPSLLLSDVEASLGDIAGAKGSQAKLRLAVELLSQAAPLEARYLIKLALGDMRTGVRQSLIEEAVVEAYSAKLADVRHAGMLVGDLPEVVRMAAAGTLADARMKLFHSLGFMLASPVASVDEAIARFATELVVEQGGSPSESEHMDKEVGDNPDESSIAPVTVSRASETALSQAYIEDKFDGIRCQLHCGDLDHPGRVALFSRTREDLTASFPELVTAFVTIQTPLILDGEILAWDPAQGRARPFSSLQQRIGRKKVPADLQRAVPVIYMAFDVLFADGNLLLGEPLSRRREILESILRDHGHTTKVASGIESNADQSSLFDTISDGEAFQRLMLSPAIELGSAQQLDQAYVDARAHGNEGVMIKSRNSLYQPGRRGLAWLKLKRELATLDVVVTAAEFGHGRRAGVLSDYTFAVRDGDRLRNVGKAYSGLTDAEIDTLTQFFREHTLEDYGRVRSVEPVIVLEVAFNNVMRSDRHDSGFALRFPRILRIRDDKPVSEIDTLNRVEEIYASQPDKPVDAEAPPSGRVSGRDGGDAPLRDPLE